MPHCHIPLTPTRHVPFLLWSDLPLSLVDQSEVHPKLRDFMPDGYLPGRCECMAPFLVAPAHPPSLTQTPSNGSLSPLIRVNYNHLWSPRVSSLHGPSFSTNIPPPAQPPSLMQLLDILAVSLLDTRFPRTLKTDRLTESPSVTSPHSPPPSSQRDQVPL